MLFINDGSNDLLGQYSRSAASLVYATEMAGHWRHLFYNRQQQCQNLGIRYLQMITPEKQSVYPKCFPYPIATPTPLLEGIEVVHTEPWFLRSQDLLSAEAQVKPLYRLDDSHLTTEGTEVIVRALAARLNLAIPEVSPDLHPVERPSDLRPCFMDDAPEPCMEAYSWADIPEPQIVAKFDPGGGHIGRRIIYRNPGSPNQRKVVCFGSSTFDLGRSSNQLTWWLSRLCSEFHFIWSPSFDHEYLGTVAPDIAIGQTVERFLRVIPVS